MKMFLFVLVLTVNLINSSNAQLAKHTWLIGGFGNLILNKNESTEMLQVKETKIDIEPNIGYFFFERFAAGVRLQATFDKMTAIYENQASKNRQLGIGPFLRYYFLPDNQSFNIVLEGDYQHLTLRNGAISNGSSDMITFYTTNRSAFSLATGPVFYFNSSVGLEALLRYVNSSTRNDPGRNQSFQLDIGLQIHLEKDNP